MKIDKQDLIRRIQLYRDGEQARCDKANKARQEKYEADRAKFEAELMPHFENLYKVLDKSIIDKGVVPDYEDIPEYFRNNTWRYILQGPSQPQPEKSSVEYYDTLLNFLASVKDETISEVGMARAGFHDIGRFFANPETPGLRHRARG